MIKILSKLLFLIFVSACAQGTNGGNPEVVVTFSNYSALAFNSKTETFSINSITMCFKRLRFKQMGEVTSDPTTDEDNVDFEIGEKTLSPSGTTLGSVIIPAGIYTRVEFDLEKYCMEGTSGNSITVSNTQTGSPFSTQDRITIKFDGVFEADQAKESLSLGIQNIITALDSVTSDDDIKTKLEAASGTIN